MSKEHIAQRDLVRFTQDKVPVMYDGAKGWRDDLVSQDDGSFLETNIPLHLAFARCRKSSKPTHLAQVVRLAKYWVRRMKVERDGFRFKLSISEMICAKMCDDGVDFSDYAKETLTWSCYVGE